MTANYNLMKERISNAMPSPVLSIITVCYLAKDAVQTTIENILKQSWTNFEYIVVDGDSNDGTLELLDQSRPILEEKKIPMSIISEPDKGIYDAMNKGAKLAKGEWLLFLNAGDKLASTDVLQKVFSTHANVDVIYGDTICTYNGQNKIYPALPLENLSYEMAFCHQSVFIKREELLAHPYDITYRVCADHRLFLSLYLENKRFEYHPFPFSIYEIAGYSDQNIMKAHKEQLRMQKELGVFKLTPGWLKREFIFYTKQGIKTLFGQKIIDFVRKKRLR